MITILDDKERRQKLLGFDFTKSDRRIFGKTPIVLIGKRVRFKQVRYLVKWYEFIYIGRKEISKTTWVFKDMLKDFPKLIQDYEDFHKPPKLEDLNNYDVIVDMKENNDQESKVQNPKPQDHRLVSQLEANEILARGWIKGGSLCEVDNTGKETITVYDRSYKKRTEQEKVTDKINKQGRIVIQLLESEHIHITHKVLQKFNEHGKPQGQFETDDCVDKILNMVLDQKNGQNFFFVSWKVRNNGVKPLPTWYLIIQ